MGKSHQNDEPQGTQKKKKNKKYQKQTIAPSAETTKVNAEYCDYILKIKLLLHIK